MADIKDIFGGPFVPSNKQVDPPELQLADAMRSAGIEPPRDIKIDGQLHRFSTKGPQTRRFRLVYCFSR